MSTTHYAIQPPQPAFKIVLGSQSSPRKLLLNKLNVDFECISPNIDETALPDETPKDLSLRLSIAKAHAVANKLAEPLQPTLIIAADQVASLVEDDGSVSIFGKPETSANACAQLMRQSGRLVTFYTALTVLNSRTGKLLTCVETTKVYFKQLDAAAIARYVEHEQPLACAGSFQVEGYGITLIERIESADPNTLIGLPLIRLVGFLADFGLQLP